MSDPKDDVMGPAIIMQGSPECLNRMATRGSAKPDFTVTAVKLRAAWEKDGQPGFILVWETASAGFGELTVYLDEKGEPCCDTEAMSMRFVREVFAKFTESLKVVG